ncbi:TolC family protein [Hyphomonas sp. GM-8P]|uniref:TolC family protein n=1 Tax=Hyphomonas sp. GM-8P TaxID=1280945 RepID=UPI000DC03D0E|nr:hypothetical protein HY26_12105 [Hyphomonas sp. GM-8P]
MKRSILFAGTAFLAACASSPANLGGLAGERVDFFAQAPDAPAEWMASGVTGKAPKGDWLSQFNDPVMLSLVSEALENNPSLKSRAATMRAAEAATRTARSAGRPSLDASVSAGATSTGVKTATGTDRIDSEIYGVGLDASWELDLWGPHRRIRERSRGRLCRVRGRSGRSGTVAGGPDGHRLDQPERGNGPGTRGRTDL